MLERIQAFLQKLGQSHPASDFEPGDPRVAFVALSFQVMEADGHVSRQEQRQLRDLLRERYNLSDSRLETLINIGEQAGNEATGYHRFTNDLKRHIVRKEERVELLDILWKLARADGHSKEIEDHVIWRIAELLGVDDPALFTQHNKVSNQATHPSDTIV